MSSLAYSNTSKHLIKAREYLDKYFDSIIYLGEISLHSTEEKDLPHLSHNIDSFVTSLEIQLESVRKMTALNNYIERCLEAALRKSKKTQKSKHAQIAA